VNASSIVHFITAKNLSSKDEKVNPIVANALQTTAIGAFQPKSLLYRSSRPYQVIFGSFHLAAFNIVSRPALLPGIGTRPSHDGVQ
jgi:hypothetical protein